MGFMWGLVLDIYELVHAVWSGSFGGEATQVVFGVTLIIGNWWCFDLSNCRQRLPVAVPLSCKHRASADWSFKQDNSQKSSSLG